MGMTMMMELAMGDLLIDWSSLHSHLRGSKAILPSISAMIRDIGFFIFPGFQLLDLTGPLVAFEVAGRSTQPGPYRLHIMSENGGLVASTAKVEISTVPIRNQRLDT